MEKFFGMMSSSSSSSSSRRSDPTEANKNNSSGNNGYYSTVSSAPPKRRAGRTKFRETRHPVYKGVRRRNADKWVCEVREPNKKSRIWLGTFPTADMAARAHDVAAMALRGRSACLNFADSAWLLPSLPSSASPREIQRAAAEAAEAFRPPELLANVLLPTTGEDEEEEEEEEEEENSIPTAAAAAAMAAATPAAADGAASWYADGSSGGGEGLDWGMQGYFGDMGMLSPPHSWGGSYSGAAAGGGGGSYWDDVEDDGDVSLWSYSI